jgi:hypothetical protein
LQIAHRIHSFHQRGFSSDNAQAIRGFQQASQAFDGNRLRITYRDSFHELFVPQRTAGRTLLFSYIDVVL